MLRSYLSFVAVIYFALAVWCSLDPETTTKTVGFERIGGSGRSEFLVVYGGLELALAICFLLPWRFPEFAAPMLWACVVIHACLVVFRTVSFVCFTDISASTYKLAVGEWVILLLGMLVIYSQTRISGQPG